MLSTSSSCMDYYLTTEAKNLLAKLDPEEQLIAVIEDLSHDGYDKYGPESDLWDLDFITQKNGEYIYYSCHWENWFHKGTVKEYDIQTRNLVKNMLLNGYGFKKIVDLSHQNEHLRSYVRKLHKPKTISRLLEISPNYDHCGEMAFYQLQDKSYLLRCESRWVVDKIYIIEEFDNIKISDEYKKYREALSIKIKETKESDYLFYQIKNELRKDFEPTKQFKLTDIDTHIQDEDAKKWLQLSVTFMK